MSKCDRLLGAHECYEEGNAAEIMCQKCPFEYGILDENGDHARWTCNADKLHRDMTKLLADTRACLSTIIFMLNEYKKPDSEKHVVPFRTTEDMANYFSLMVGIINKEYE